MAEVEMMTPHGARVLHRLYASHSSPLRAWSAADSLALDHLGKRELGAVLIVNDDFGALSVGLAHAEPVVWGDSALSRAAIDHNLGLNALGPLGKRSVPGNEVPEGPFDTVVFGIPKTTALLEWQLESIAPLLRPEAEVLGCAMTRHIHTSTLELFEKHIGPTTTSLAKRKARLIHAEVSRQERTAPELRITSWRCDDIEVAELPGTFSAGHLDVGTAVLLDVLSEQSPPSTASAPVRVLDLGCGNGVVGATVARQWPSAHVVLTDVSDLAAMAAQETCRRNQLSDRCSVRAQDGLHDIATGSIDVVVTNPPFHQGHALDGDLTDRLLRDVARVLAEEGLAYIVAQRHLNLHGRLRRWFGSVDTVSKHPTHVVFVARQSKNSDRTK